MTQYYVPRWLVAVVGMGLATITAPSLPTVHAYECLTTPNGIPRKVIIKKEDVRVADDIGAETRLRFFRKYFVFKERNNQYQIGSATVRASILGWVSKEDVLPWNTEQAVFFINKAAAGRKPIRIWQAERDIGNSSKPCFEESLAAEHTTEPFPILSRKGDFVKVAFLWDAKGHIPAIRERMEDGEQARLAQGSEVSRGSDGKHLNLGTAKLRHVMQQARRMDVVLVLDVTGSMKPYMDQVNTYLERIVERLITYKGTKAEVRVGVVAYRDYIDDEPGSFLTRSLDLTPDMKSVNDFMGRLQPGGGGEINEAACEALHQAALGMLWGEHSFRVMFLITDAPPHMHDDADTVYLQDNKRFVQSVFFGRKLDENLNQIKKVMKDERVHLFVMAVGKHEHSEAARTQLRRFTDDAGRFLPLEDESSFIRKLALELGNNRKKHDQILNLIDDVQKPDKRVVDLDESQLQMLQAVNIDPTELKEMRQERIQTGWFKPAVGQDSAVCVYARRKELDDWARELQLNLNDFKVKQEDILTGIAARHLGSKPATIADMYRQVQGIEQPDMLRLENLGAEDQVIVRRLRQKLINLHILLLTEKLFSEFEEGWVPMEYLPGALSELRKPRR